MMRFAGASVLFAMVATTAACGVGGDDDASPSKQQGGVDDSNQKNGVTCTAELKISGTFTPGTPARPTDPDTMMPVTGCWPVGTWTFTAAVSTNTCATAPTPLAGYSFTLNRGDDPDGLGLSDTLANTTASQPAGELNHVAMDTSAQGCTGHLELGSMDGLDYWNLNPVLLNSVTDNSLTGTGEYERFAMDGWPWR
ncbi:MAG TPA: hypothetical protein VH165_31055 [Kofleriaceae bacterium]|jgi:hypothetical protein|nr:hypothetical protein [Kofleriaceae bacterium]